MTHTGPAIIPTPAKITPIDGRIELPTHRLPNLRNDTPTPDWIMCDTRCMHLRGDYSLILNPSESRPIRVLHRTDEGRRNGLATLRQLMRAHGRTIPACRIEDTHPHFRIRGVMLDVSRNRIPTMRDLFETVETLAELKCNHLQLYVEHTFAYPGHEPVWQGHSAITPDELKRLDDWCQLHCIDLCANQNCFGHLSGVLQTTGYEHLAETHDDYDFYGIRRKGPFSLCPTDPKSLDLVREWLDVMVPLCSGPIVNIGCDETADVGSGRSTQAVQDRGYADVYYDYVNQIADHVHRLGKRPMLWADIAAAHPDKIKRFPPCTIAGVWGYEPDSPFKEHFGLLKPLCQSHGVELWTCPGASSWRSFTGRTSERNKNYEAAFLTHLADGALICDWGDVGHRQVWPLSLRSLAQGLAIGWSLFQDSNPKAISLHALRDPTGQAADWLDELGDVDHDLRQSCDLKNATALFSELHPARPEHAQLGDLATWRDIRDRLDHLIGRIPHTRPQLRAELQHAADCALLAADVAIARREGARLDQDRLDAVIADHRRLWLARSRPGGLDASCQHYERLRTQPPFAKAPR